MTFRHIVMWLKADGQKGSIKSRMAKWEALDEAVGAWKEDYPTECNLYLMKIWGDGEGKKVPFLCGKQGIIHPYLLSGATHHPFREVDTPNLEELPAPFRVGFSEASNVVERLIDQLSDCAVSYIGLLQYKEEVSWSFGWDGWLDAFSTLHATYQKATKEVASWQKDNLTSMGMENGKAQASETAKRIARYRKHLTDCAHKPHDMAFSSRHTLSCLHCGSEWSYSKEGMGVPLALIESEKQMKKALSSYEQMTETIARLQEEGLSVQKKYRFIQWGDIIAIQQLLQSLSKVSRKEGVSFAIVEDSLDAIGHLARYQTLLETDFSGKWQKRRNVRTVHRLFHDLFSDRHFPKTKATYDKRLSKWQAALDAGTAEWDAYRQNIVKNLPMQYPFGSVTFSFTEAKTALEAVKWVDGDFGLHTVADMLKGANNQKLREYGLTKSPWYGTLSGHKKNDLLALLEGMLGKGWLKKVGYDYPKLHLTDTGSKQLERMDAKGQWLENDESALDYMKEDYMKQPVGQFLQQVENEDDDVRWKMAYMEKWFERDAFTCYRRLLTYIKDQKSAPSVIADFLVKHYEERYQPIYAFYRKTVAKNHPTMQVLCDRVCVTANNQQIS